MWVCWHKGSDIGQNVQEVITRLGIRNTHGYFEDTYSYGVLSIRDRNLYGLSDHGHDPYLLIDHRDQLYQISLLTSIGLNGEEISSIIGDTHVD